MQAEIAQSLPLKRNIKLDTIGRYTIIGINKTIRARMGFDFKTNGWKKLKNGER